MKKMKSFCRKRHFQVNLTINKDIEQQVREWLPTFVKKILAIDGFEYGEIYSYPILERPGFVFGTDESKCYYVAQYKITNKQYLDTYFEKHAEQLRKDGISRFGDGVTITKRLLTNMFHLTPK